MAAAAAAARTGHALRRGGGGGGRAVVVNASVSHSRNDRRKMRHVRIRKTLSGSTERPRLSIFRSNKEIYAQVIDDTEGLTLAAASTMSQSIKALLAEAGKKHGSDKESAAMVGKAIAEKCIEKGITKVAFDRGGYKYHGRVAALADAAREGGLDF